MTRRGVTLVETVVVAGLLAAVAGVLLVAVQKARRAADGAGCQNALRQQALAVLGYESAKGRLPPGGAVGPFDPLGVPAGVAHGLWPAVRGQLGADVPYRFDLPSDHPDNRPTLRVPTLECPATAGVGGPVGAGGFLADLGATPGGNLDGPLPVNGRVRLVEVSDGTSCTLLLAAGCGRHGLSWSDPATTVPLRQVSQCGWHGGPEVAFADGAVRRLHPATPAAVRAAMATRAGGEAVAD